MVWIVVLSFVFVECAVIVGLFLPGDTLLFAAGVILAEHDAAAGAWWLSLVALIVAVAANQVGYLTGRKVGTRFIARRGGKILNTENLEKARDFLDRRGLLAIVLARWLPWVRTLAPLIAGAARMDPRRFMLATTVGAVLWVPTLVLLGYYGAGVLDGLPWLQDVVLWGTISGVALGTAWGIWKYRQEVSKPLEDATGTADEVIGR
ncbi:MAG: DedA family protein [Thermocrispum sp.]